ncbi:helix-turn-helix domain-containing protein [Amycolatopsis thermoflava]|uniref:helix-turn-helix domain-containing protein n=1 Tax=Amycolatopsis thermoflava TaxID=84480 RepID=UPI0004019B3C|nr:helix-turn-helix transcriptional regulator [Amycolatopsis thermoflava]
MATEPHTLVAELVATRKRLGISQEEIADRMGMQRPQVSMFETGRREPRLSTLMRYADALGARLGIEVTG